MNIFLWKNKFPVHKKKKKKKAKVGKQSNISINVFDYEDETPYPFYSSKEIFEKHLDLILLSKILFFN